MLISDSRRLLFVHIQKTGGESIAKLLAQQLPDIRRFGAKHEFARSGMAQLGSAWNQYFKFAFVRNPWDRLVSWYSMIEQAKEISWQSALLNRRKKSHLRQRRDNPLWQYVYDNSSTFDEFIKNCVAEIESGEGAPYSFAYNQIDYLTDENGNVIVDFIGRFEKFSEDLKEIGTQIGIRISEITRANPSAHRHYTSYYTPEVEKIVRERFARDIQYFGYKFEPGD